MVTEQSQRPRVLCWVKTPYGTACCCFVGLREFAELRRLGLVDETLRLVGSLV